MDATQFATFIKNIINAIAAVGTETAAGSMTRGTMDTPKISIKLPTFKGEPNKNVDIWLRQIKNIFHAQKIKKEKTMIHYTIIAFENAALHWFTNKVKDTGNTPAFAN